VPPPKNLSQSEEVAENIAQVGGVEACTSVSTQPGVTEAVVDAALIDIREHRVGFAALFEFSSRRVVGIAVGMELQRQFR